MGSPRLAVAAFGQIIHADRQLESIQFIDDLLISLMPSLLNDLEASRQPFAMMVKPKAQDMQRESLMMGSNLDARQHLDLMRLPGENSLGVSGHGVVIGNREGRYPFFFGSSHDFKRTHGAIGQGGMDVQINQGNI